MSNNENGGGGPCGACKFLRRKCVNGCIFAPYFDSEQGTAHFAAVHKVFGASNASKLLLRLPPHTRLHAVVTLCYEALARVRDPVYGCVSHIFTLQQQVVNLQAELAFVQARLSTMQPERTPPADLSMTSTSDNTCNMPMNYLNQPTTMENNLPSFCNVPTTNDHQDHDEGDLQALPREFVSRYIRLRP